MIEAGKAVDATVRAVLLGGPLDGLKFETRNNQAQVFMVNVGGRPHCQIYRGIPPSYQVKLYDVGVYGLPGHPYQSNGFWVFEWVGWVGKKG